MLLPCVGVCPHLSYFRHVHHIRHHVAFSVCYGWPQLMLTYDGYRVTPDVTPLIGTLLDDIAAFQLLRYQILEYGVSYGFEIHIGKIRVGRNVLT